MVITTVKASPMQTTITNMMPKIEGSDLVDARKNHTAKRPRSTYFTWWRICKSEDV